MAKVERFEVSAYSLAEAQYLLDNLGQPALVVLGDEEDVPDLPKGVNPAAVRPILQRAYDLEQVFKARHIAWSGFDAMKKVLKLYLAWMQLVKAAKRAVGRNEPAEDRRAANFPSGHLWDDGVAAYYGIGADAGRLLSMIDDDGNRVPLWIDLRRPVGAGGISGLAGVLPWLKAKQEVVEAAREKADAVETKTKAPDRPALQIKSFGKRGENQSIECPICGHTETFKTGSAISKQSAMGRMARHLKTARGNNVDRKRHLEVHTRTFVLGKQPAKRKTKAA